MSNSARSRYIARPESRYRREMEEARALLARLDRIEALEDEGAPAAIMLEEVRALLAEAEAWVRTERAAAELAEGTLERCRAALRSGGSTGRTLLA
jgi:hypothetical protein